MNYSTETAIYQVLHEAKSWKLIMTLATVFAVSNFQPFSIIILHNIFYHAPFGTGEQNNLGSKTQKQFYLNIQIYWKIWEIWNKKTHYLRNEKEHTFCQCYSSPGRYWQLSVIKNPGI